MTIERGGFNMTTMYDDCIATARDMISARLVAKHQALINSELRGLKYQMVGRNFGSWYVTKFNNICESHLNTLAQTIFEILEQNLVGPGISSPTLNQKLKAEFSTQFNTHTQQVFEILENEKKNLQTGRYFRAISLDNLKGRLLLDYHAQIDLLCRKIASAENKPPQSTNIGSQTNFYGPDNKVQIGDHNVLQIPSSAKKHHWSMAPLFWATVGILILTAIGTWMQKQDNSEKQSEYPTVSSPNPAGVNDNTVFLTNASTSASNYRGTSAGVDTSFLKTTQYPSTTPVTNTTKIISN